MSNLCDASSCRQSARELIRRSLTLLHTSLPPLHITSLRAAARSTFFHIIPKITFCRIRPSTYKNPLGGRRTAAAARRNSCVWNDSKSIWLLSFTANYICVRTQLARSASTFNDFSKIRVRATPLWTKLRFAIFINSWAKSAFWNTYAHRFLSETDMHKFFKTRWAKSTQCNLLAISKTLMFLL